MEEMIIGLGADNSKLLKILNNTQTSIDKFLGSKGIKDLQKLDIKFDESSFKNALKNYEKNVTKTLSKIKKGFSITIGDGDEITEIPIIPRKGIKNVHELNNALKNLKKYRESALEGTKDIDNLIRKLENASFAIKDLNKYFGLNKKAGLSLAQIGIAIDSLDKQQSKINANDKNGLQQILALEKEKLRLKQQANLMTANKGYNDEVNASKARIQSLQEEIKLAQQRDKILGQKTFISNMSKSVEKETDEAKKLKELKQIETAYNKLRNMRGGTLLPKEAQELKQVETQINNITAAIKRRNEEARKGNAFLNDIDKKTNRVDVLTKEYNNTPVEKLKERIALLNQIINIQKELNRIDPSLAPNLNQNKQLLETERELLRVRQLSEKIKKSENLISGYNQALSNATDEQQKLNILRKIKTEWEAIRKLQGGKLTSNQLGEYNRILNDINRITNATRQQNEETRKQKKLKQEIANLEREISNKENSELRRGKATDLGAMRNQRRELLQLIGMYEKLHKKQRQQGVAIDTAPYQRALQDLRNLENRMIRINGSASSLRTTLGHLFGGYQMIRFARTLAETTGYFEAQKIAMESILRDAGAAQKIFNQLKDFSLKSPFEFKDLLTQTKQLAAFQVPTEELFETTKRLGDLSAGLGVDMNRLILAYGQVKSAAFLRGQEVRQFTEAGVPLVQALADKFTVLEGKVVSAGDVFERISKRMVSFEMVKDVLWELTDETGKFYNMQEVLSQTVQGRILNLKDAWNQALASIGSDRVSVINGVLKVLAWMLENVRFWMYSIIGVGFAYSINRMSSALKGFNNAIARAGGGLRGFGKALKGLSFGGWFQIITVVGSAIAGLISNINHKKNELKKALAEIADSFDKETKRLVNSFNKLANDAVSAGDGTEKQLKALEQIKSQYKDYIPLLDLEIEKIRAMRGEYDLLTQAIENAQEAKKIQAQKEEVFSKAKKHYFGEDNEFSKIFKESDVLMDLGLGRETSYFGENKALRKQVEEDLSSAFSKLLEKGEPITLKSLYDAAQEVSDLYIRDVYYYKRVSDVSRKSAKALFDDMSSSEYSKSLADIYRREGRVNPLKNTLDKKTQEYEESLKTLPVQGKTNEQIKKDKDLLSMGLMFDQIGIVQNELSNAIRQAKPNLTTQEYTEYLKRINENATYFNEIRDAYIEVLTDADKTTSADDDAENLYSLVSTYTSKLQNVDKILSGTFFNLTNIFGTFLNNVGWLYDWQRDVNSYIDKSGDNELKSFSFSSNNINEDGTKIREEFEKKIQTEYDKAKSELEKYIELNSNLYSKEELDAIKKGYEEKMLHMKELAKLINYEIDPPKKESTGRKFDYESDYNKRLSALQAFVKKYTELLKTYSHEKAIEILQGDKDGLISQFVATEAKKKASRETDKNGTEYRAGLGGYEGWNEQAFIQDSSKLKEQIDAVVDAEIKRAEQLQNAGRISKSAISELYKIKKDLANIGIEEAFERLQNVLNENARKLEHNNNIADFFNTLTSLGVSPTKAAEISSYAGGIMGLYGSKVNNKKSEIQNLMKETELGNFSSFDLSNIGGIEDAIKKVFEMGTKYDSEGNKIYAEKTIKDLIKLLEELKRLQKDDITKMYEIVNKYSIVAQQQARENEADKQKAVSNETTMDFATDLLKVENIGDANSLMKGIYGNLNAIDFTKQNENDQAFIKNYDEQMKFFFGDFSNVSGNMIRKLQDDAKGLREQLIKTGQLTPQLAEYFDKLDIALINASKGVKSFFENLSMKGTTRRDTANSMVDMIKALSSQGDSYLSAKIAFDNNKNNEKTAKKNFEDAKSKLNTQVASIASFANQNYKDPTELIELVQKIFEAITSGNVGGITSTMNEATSYAGNYKNVSFSHQGTDEQLAKLGNIKGKLESLNAVVEQGQNVIDSFASAFAAVGDIVAAFGDKTEGATEVFEEIQYFMDDMSSAYAAISPIIGLMISMITLAEALKVAGIECQLAWWWIMLIVVAIAGVIAGAMYAFKKHDRDLEEQIEERRRQIEKLQNELKQLDWERDVSGDPFKNSEERLERLAEITRKERENLRDEQEKKKKDEEAIAEAEEAVAQAKRDEYDAWLELRDEIIGSAADISNTLGDAFFDAFAEGTNAARAMGNAIKNIIGDALKKALINRYLLPQINKVLDTIFPQGEDISPEDFLDSSKWAEAKEQLDKVQANWINMFEAIPNDMKELLMGTGDNSLTSGIQGVTEETASIIASYMNSVREALLIQSGHVKDISVGVLSINENYLPNIQTHLLNISTNTSTMNQNINNMLTQVLAIINGTKSFKVRM